MELPDGSAEDYIAEHCGDEGFDCDLLREIAEANRKWGAQTGIGHADHRGVACARRPSNGRRRCRELRKVV